MLCGAITNRLMERLQRLLVRRGLSGKLVYVIELQKRGAIHWHIVFQGRLPNKSWALSTKNFDEIADDVFRNHGFIYETISAACRVERVKKSLVGYLSKYLSKGNYAPVKAFDAHPKQWWGTAGGLLEDIKNGTIRMTAHDIQTPFSFFDLMERLAKIPGMLFVFPCLIEKFRKFTVNTMGKDEHSGKYVVNGSYEDEEKLTGIVGIYGRIKIHLLDEIIQEFDCITREYGFSKVNYPPVIKKIEKP